MKSKKNTDLLEKLKKHPYLGIALVYLGSAMAVMHFCEMVFPVIHLPHWSVSLVIILALIGLPIVLLMRWGLQKKHSRARSKKTTSSAKTVKSQDQTNGTEQDPHIPPEEFRHKHSWKKIGIALTTSILIFIAAVFIYARFLYKPKFTGKEKSIAVLPFLNIGGDKKNDIWSDGLTEDITAKLGMIKGLKVTSRTSAMRYRQGDKSIRQIAEELGVSAILEGSVLCWGNKIRITAQLIDALTDEHIWTETYDKTMDDFFEIQLDVSTHIAEALKASLNDETIDKISKPPTKQIDAYAMYLKGRIHWNKRTKADLLLAIRYFDTATQYDPGYVRAYSGIADSYTLLCDNGFLPVDSVASKARVAIDKALSLDSTLPEVRASHALYLSTIEGNTTGAIKEFEKVISINANYSSAFLWLALELAAKGRFNKSLEYIDKAINLDPVTERVYSSKALIYYYARQYARAINHLNQTPEMIGKNNISKTLIAQIYYIQGIKDSAKYYSQLSGDRMWILLTKPDIPAFKNEIKTLASSSSVSAEEIAYYYTLANEKDSAIIWLNKSVDNKEYSGLKFLAVSPQWDSLRSDSRFNIILQKQWNTLNGYKPELFRYFNLIEQITIYINLAKD